MATAARDRLARMLRGDAQTSFSTEMTAKTDDLSLEVEGFGPVRLPVTPAKARKLCSLGQPARFGRGEQTLTDPDVRDTWEVPKHLIRARWNDAELKAILATIKAELGLPGTADLTADLHSMLVYEPGQHFLSHQDSEKDDSMIGTLVVTLLSRYTGGELVVGHNGERKTYQGSRTALSLVAFYADCRHEVLSVKSGYRIALTYNLLMRGDTGRPAGREGIAAELATLLREHFSTPLPRYHGGPVGDPPKRLVYFLDHEYTSRGLTWRRLKGADASRVALLRTAADQAGCEAVLALADLRTTHGAFPRDDDYRYGRRWDDYHDYDEDADGSGDEKQYEIHELVHSGITLTHWTRPDGTGLEQTSLSVLDTEACASTPTGDLAPYESEYEGYMGNYGNTLDRWYHRSAVALWSRELAFANRAEASPSWALAELPAMASGGDLAGSRTAAATLAPFWDSAVHGRFSRAGENAEFVGQELVGQALLAADAVADANIATMLLHPFVIEDLSDAHVTAFVKIAGSYGQQWTGDLLRTWFGGDRATRGYGAGAVLQRPQWIADHMPGLCAGLNAGESAGTAAARRLLDLTWEWAGAQIRMTLGLSPPRYRDEQLRSLGKPLAAIVTAAAAIGATSIHDQVSRFIRGQSDPVALLALSALRAAVSAAAKKPRDADGRPGNGGFGDLAAECAARLRARLARPRRAADDWSIQLPAEGCACTLCGTLRAFLQDKDRRGFEWRLAKDDRQHVHNRIDGAGLPVTHLTRRVGRPYTLVLQKTDALFSGEQESRIQDEADLEWLTAKWHPGT